MKRLRNVIYTTIKSINIFALFFMFFILFLQVITRKVLNNPLPWPEELSLIAMIWITFFGAYQCTVEDNHLKMDFLQDQLPERLKPYILLLSKGLIGIFLILTVIWAYSFIQQSGNIGMPVTDIPMRVPYMIIWISFILMTIEILAQILSEIKRISNGQTQNSEGTKKGGEKCSQS
ncbi:TRAP transporter small permease [Alkalihalobacillus sp. TS-13]|uniref:TRAP transporter small permease n=1 Tax=Alkalihalobacillus sp. TS-13 TaxID=2842455 RepID=UPI001C882306|nr:TRAP transporter small permease [Alkalihalobacillus sp. TS-13]